MTYPAVPVAAGHVEPCPRRVRATAGGRVVLDTERALYRWEWPPYPQWYLHPDDLTATVRPTGAVETSALGRAEWVDLVTDDAVVERAGRRWTGTGDERLEGRVRLEWDRLERWFEEDEQVYVHPRSPYVRVDALRAGRQVRVELEGVVLAETSCPVLVFETGLPTRFYLPPTDVRADVLVASDTVTSCPYKGTTSQWWSVRLPGRPAAEHAPHLAPDLARDLARDLAWSYAFPTRQLLPVAGMVAFYDERVDTFVDGTLRARPVTHFS